MLEQEVPSSTGALDDDPIIDPVDLENELHLRMLINKSEVIEYTESCITPDRPVILFTWSPDPKELPDCDFNTQHEFMLETVAKFLTFCLTGCACVEANLSGNPHYHGWFQTTDSPQLEMKRIGMIKMMQHYAPRGLVIIPAVKYKINSYTPTANSLYYYKKDLYSSMFEIYNNPITKYSTSNVNWNECLYFFKPQRGRISSYELEKRVTNRSYFEKFYQNSRL